MKHLIKDNQIVQSGIPSHFTRKNGESFWGGYENRTDLHYEDGWREEVLPEYNPVAEQLGELFYSQVHDLVSRTVQPIAIDMEPMKRQLYSELEYLRTEMANTIVQIKLNYETEPDGLLRLMPTIRAMYGFAKLEIEALREETVQSYVLRSPKYEQLLRMLKSFL